MTNLSVLPLAHLPWQHLRTAPHWKSGWQILYFCSGYGSRWRAGERVKCRTMHLSASSQLATPPLLLSSGSVRSSFFARQSPTFHLMTISVIVVHHRMPHASIIKRQRSNTKKTFNLFIQYFFYAGCGQEKGEVMVWRRDWLCD